MQKLLEQDYLEFYIQASKNPYATHFNSLKEKATQGLYVKHNLHNYNRTKYILNNLKPLIGFTTITPDWQLLMYAKGLEILLSSKDCKQFINDGWDVLRTAHGELCEEENK